VGWCSGHTNCAGTREIGASWLAVVTRRADRVSVLAQFLWELRDLLNELDSRPLDWAVLGWKMELPIP